mgnify:CR=1 FL=1
MIDIKGTDDISRVYNLIIIWNVNHSIQTLLITMFIVYNLIIIWNVNILATGSINSGNSVYNLIIIWNVNKTILPKTVESNGL